jgi:hypothetical protein
MTYPRCGICHESIITFRRGRKPGEHGRCRMLLKAIERKVREEVRQTMAPRPTPRPKPVKAPRELPPLCDLCGWRHRSIWERLECEQRAARSSQALADWRGA